MDTLCFFFLATILVTTTLASPQTPPFGGLNLNLDLDSENDVNSASALGIPGLTPDIAKKIADARARNAQKAPSNEATATAGCVPIYKRCSARKGSRPCCGTNTCVESEGPGTVTLCLPPLSGVSSTASEPDPPKCPYTARIEQILEPLRDGEEFNRTVEYLSHHKLEYIYKAAYRGDATQNYQMTIRDIHLLMRENYRSMITAIGNNIYPLIIASDAEPGSVSGVGGTFTLYLEDGSMRRITPTSPLFEMSKNLAHMPLGLFTIVSPYFLTPNAPTWQPAMRTMQARVQDAIVASTLGPIRLPDDVKAHSLQMLQITARYIKDWLAAGRVTIDDFEKYTREMIPYIEQNIKTAAALQVQSLLPHLQQWKDDLGERWKDVYAIIPTIWPVSAINPRMQVLAQLMTPEQVKGQVLLLENAGSVLDQRATLGRILGDRAAALMILGTQTRTQTKLTFALSTKQDLLANSCSDAIKDFFDGIRAKRK